MFHVPRAQKELKLGKARECNHLAIHSDGDTPQHLAELPGATRNTRHCVASTSTPTPKGLESGLRPVLKIKTKMEEQLARGRTVGLLQCSG